MRALTILMLFAASTLCVSGQTTADGEERMSIEGHDAIASFLRQIAPAVDSARATWPGIRRRFLDGLPDGATLTATTILKDDSGRFEVVEMSVEKIASQLIHGRIVSTIAMVHGFKEGDDYAIPEDLLFDWTYSTADGTPSEGDFIGRLIEANQQQRGDR